MVIVAVALTLVGTAGARAGGQLPPLSLSGIVNGQVSGPSIEQQSYWISQGMLDPDHTIVNPDHAVYGTWDINEHNVGGGEGTLDGGVTVTTQAPIKIVWESNPIYQCLYGMCAWWSGPHHDFGTLVRSDSPNLDVQACFQPQGRCFDTGTPLYDGTRGAYPYTYRFCGKVVYTPTDPALQYIPGSALAPNTTEGIGVPSSMSVTVTNTATGRKSQAKDVRVSYGISSDLLTESGCSPTGNTSGDHIPLDQFDYPYSWTTT